MKRMKREYQWRRKQGSPLYPQEGFTKFDPCSTCLYFPIADTMNKKGCDGKKEGVVGALLPQQGGGRRRGVAGEVREPRSRSVVRMNQNL